MMKKYQLSETKHLFIEEFEGEVRAKVGFDDERDNGIWHTITMEPKEFTLGVIRRDQVVLMWEGDTNVALTSIEISGDVMTTRDVKWLRSQSWI